MFFFEKSMSTQLFSPEISIEEIISKILVERRVTSTEQMMLRCVLLLEEELDEEERTLIGRVFYGIRHGLLTIVE